MNQSTLPYPITLADMIAEVERELAMRRSLRTRLKSTRLIDRRIDVMLAILDKLQRERDGNHNRPTILDQQPPR